MKKLTKKTLASFVLTLCISFAATAISTRSLDTHQNDSEQFVEQLDNTRIDSIHTKFVHEIDNFIQSNYPKSELTGINIANACIKHEFDPCFLLAQGIVESGLGTAGRAKRTGSPWNVGQYNGRTVHEMNKLGLTHNDPNNAIEPYIILVKTNYLGVKRTYDDLMQNYITLSGHRYASDELYERNLRFIYKRIRSDTPIYELYIQLINT